MRWIRPRCLRGARADLQPQERRPEPAHPRWRRPGHAGPGYPGEVQAAFLDDPTEATLVSYEPQHVDDLRRQSDLPIPAHPMRNRAGFVAVPARRLAISYTAPAKQT
jgi:hypothetical protein